MKRKGNDHMTRQGGMPFEMRWITHEEYLVVQGALRDRRTYDRNERHLVGSPDICKNSLGGALIWAVGVIFQDNPVLLAIPALGIGIGAFNYLLAMIRWFN